MRSLKFGITTPPHYVSYGELLQVWQRADALGYDSAWLFDHFLPINGDPNGPCFEGWTMMTALAMQTQRIHVGCLVMAMGYRNPALLAKMGATADIVTGGRLELALGAGWFEQEARAYNIDFPATGTRLKQLEEGIQVIRSLWTNETSSFHGQHYQLENARCDPKPVQRPTPTIWVGGQGEKVTLRIVAQHADGWDMDMAEIGQYKRKLDILNEHCAKFGRDPKTVRKMIHFSAIIHHDERIVRAQAEQRARAWNRSVEELHHVSLIGTPAQCAEHLQQFVELGTEHFVLSIAPPYDMTMLELYVGEVAAALKRQ
ncbi:MAG: TIGR03560 family F420-dependent LLM class oxidoreductase [Anaerolineae bacterium]|nr:TIGR03560 family F420-dependent LLM class oxidoreductase [Anaerolineae bacterium]